MISLTWTCLVGCAILLFTANRAEGIKCYACSGDACKDPFNAKADGVDMQPHCMGSCSKAVSGDVVFKACLPLKKEDTCETKDKATLCICNSDLCNGSYVIVPSAVVIAVLAAVGLIFNKV